MLNILIGWVNFLFQLIVLLMNRRWSGQESPNQISDCSLEKNKYIYIYIYWRLESLSEQYFVVSCLNFGFKEAVGDMYPNCTRNINNYSFHKKKKKEKKEWALFIYLFLS